MNGSVISISLLFNGQRYECRIHVIVEVQSNSPRGKKSGRIERVTKRQTERKDQMMQESNFNNGHCLIFHLEGLYIPNAFGVLIDHAVGREETHACHTGDGLG